MAALRAGEMSSVAGGQRVSRQGWRGGSTGRHRRGHLGPVMPLKAFSKEKLSRCCHCFPASSPPSLSAANESNSTNQKITVLSLNNGSGMSKGVSAGNDTIVPGCFLLFIAQGNRMSWQVWGRRRTIQMMNPEQERYLSSKMLSSVALFLLGEVGNLALHFLQGFLLLLRNTLVSLVKLPWTSRLLVAGPIGHLWYPAKRAVFQLCCPYTQLVIYCWVHRLGPWCHPHNVHLWGLHMPHVILFVDSAS